MVGARGETAAAGQIGHRHKGGRDTRDRLPVVTGVSTRRQQIYVQGEKLVIIHDAIENRSETKRTFGQVFAVAAQRPNLADPAQRLIATANPDRANTSIRFFGRDVTFGGAIKSDASRFQPLSLDSKSGINLVSVEWTGAPRHSAATLINLLPPLAEPVERTRHDLRDVTELRTLAGAAGFSATTARGARVWFLAGPAATQPLAAGPCSTEGELLLAIERAGELSGIILGGRSVTIDGQPHRGPAADFEFQRDAAGRFTAQPIYRPIDTVEISPAQTEFTDTLSVSFAIPTQDTRDIDFRYTTDGTDPTIASALYRGPVAVSESTYLKVRPFHRGLQHTPWNVPGTDAGKTVSAHFRRVAPLPAASVATTKPGLRHRYLEGDWMELMAYAGVPGVLDAKREGVSSALFDAGELASLRATDGGYAVVYEGFIEVPREGVYQFHAPEHLYTAERDAGYDLRVFVGGREWMPNPDLHAENIWSVTLAAGLHRFKVAYVDYRVRPFRNDFWMAWWPEQIHQGTPVLEVSGPQLPKQPLPRSWLKYAAE